MNRRSTLLIAAALLAGCTGGGGDESADTTVAVPVAATTKAPVETSVPTTTLPAGLVAHPLDVSFQYGATLVTIGELLHDPAQGRALLGVRVQNLSSAWVFPELATEIELDGVISLGTYQAVDLPPGLAVDTTLEYSALAGDPADGGVLRWGRPDRTRPTVELATGTLADGGLPREMPIEGWLSIGRYAVRLTDAQLLAGSPGLNQQALDGEQVLRIGFDVFTAVQDPVNGFYPAEHLSLVGPDGSLVEALATSDGFAPVSWTTTTGNWVEFAVPADATGVELALSSISPKAMGALFPELIERVSLPLDVTPGDQSPTWAKAAVGGSPPRPSLAPLTGTDPAGAPITLALDVGGINAPGFWVRPTDLRFDPSTATVEVDLDATSLVIPEAELNPTDQVGQVVGVLDTDPLFSFTVGLASAGRITTGSILGDAAVPAGERRSFTVSFGAVTRFDPADAALLIGARSSAAASLPLGEASAIPRYPDTPIERSITAEPVTADHWTAQLVSYRLGLFSPADPPPVGFRELEVLVDVTAATDSPVKALGLGFRGSVQLFMESPDGYLIQAVADNRYVPFEPGDTHRIPVRFTVPDGFTPGTYRFVLRGADETADVTTTVWTETSVAADLGTTPVVAAAATEGMQ